MSNESEPETKKAKVISFINMKGGVGKTTLCIGLARCISEDKERVLVIDADPQFNATQSLLDDYKKSESNKIVNEEIKRLDKVDPSIKHDVDDVDDSIFNFYNKEVLNRPDDNPQTIYRLFQMSIALNRPFEMPDSSIVTKLDDNLDLLCGDLSLVLANRGGDYNFSNRIKRFISKNNLRDKYSYILIDCPPTLTVYTDAALLASDFYVIPNRIDKFSIIGIDSIEQSIANLFDESDENLPCLGIIYTMFPSTMGKKQTRTKNSFESKKIVESLDIFNTVSHKVDSIQNGLSGTNPMSYKVSRQDTEAIFSELKSRIEEYKNE